MNKKKVVNFLKYTSVFIWLSILTKTDSYFSVYLLIAIVSIVSIAKNKTTKIHHSWLDYAFSTFFSLLVTLANYQVFTQQAEKQGIYTLLAICYAFTTFICGYIVFQNILPIFKTLTIKTNKRKTYSPLRTFFICLLVFFVIDSAILFLCCYPGSLTPDSIDEIGQILSGNYSNHHPFYYTILIYPFITIGINLFHDINTGVALFNLFQILILSTAFSYSISTLQHIGISKKSTFIISIALLLLPYNLIFSFTIWKDVLFGACFLIFIVTLYRYFSNIRPYKYSPYSQILLIIISGIAICLFRSNALLAIAITVLVFFLIFKRKYLKLGIVFIFIIVISFILKRPVLQQLDIRQTDLIESLSIPSQQIVNTLKNKKEQISEEDLSLINNLANTDDLINAYNPILHDPVKNVIRDNHNQEYLKEHIIDYLSLYLRLGIKFPIYYATAWINQTKGYWNGGYNYQIWVNEIQLNDYGIERRGNTFLNEALNIYLKTFFKAPILQPLISIGLTVWIIFILLYRNILSKNKVNIFLLIPILTTWATLLIATPVFCEFRYIYFAFTTTPFLVVATFAKTSNTTNLKRIKESHEKR